MPSSSDPRVLKIQLGSELHQLREHADLTAAEAAVAIGGQAPKISKIETGKQAPTPEEVEILTVLYNAPAKRRAYLVDLANQIPKRSKRRGAYRDAVPDWFRRFFALESEATSMRLYEVEVVTGLLQTEAYAREILMSWEPASDPRLIDRRVESRLSRQDVLDRKEHPLQLDVVLSEASLHRVIGNSQIMRAQLDHLIEVSQRENIRLHISPFRTPNRITLMSSFSLLHLAEQRLSAVYLEDALGATYLWEPEEYTRYSILFERIRDSSLPPEESRELIDTMRATHK
jgi:transcriptional regulator with XRE-family HTH domain